MGNYRNSSHHLTMLCEPDRYLRIALIWPQLFTSINLSVSFTMLCKSKYCFWLDLLKLSPKFSKKLPCTFPNKGHTFESFHSYLTHFSCNCCPKNSNDPSPTTCPPISRREMFSARFRSACSTNNAAEWLGTLDRHWKKRYRTSFPVLLLFVVIMKIQQGRESNGIDNWHNSGSRTSSEINGGGWH